MASSSKNMLLLSSLLYGGADAAAAANKLRFSAVEDLAATKAGATAFVDASAIAIEGGGQRSLLLTAGVHRGMAELKKLDGELHTSNNGVNTTKTSRRDPTLASGTSGGGWGAAAMTYSRTLDQRTGAYTPPEELTVAELKKEDLTQTLTRFADPKLWSWHIPIQGKSLGANTIESGLIPSNKNNVKGWWHYFTAYNMRAVDLDPLSVMSWCTYDEAVEEFNPAEVALEKTYSNDSAHFPTAPKCQRPGAPYPVIVASDMTGYPLPFVTQMKYHKNHEALRAIMDKPTPMLEFSPHNVHPTTIFHQRDGDWADVPVNQVNKFSIRDVCAVSCSHGGY